MLPARWHSAQHWALSEKVRDCLLPPAAAERLIELYQGLVFAAPRLCQGEFCAVKRALSVWDFKVGGDASAVTRKRQVD